MFVEETFSHFDNNWNCCGHFWKFRNNYSCRGYSSKVVPSWIIVLVRICFLWLGAPFPPEFLVDFQSNVPAGTTVEIRVQLRDQFRNTITNNSLAAQTSITLSRPRGQSFVEGDLADYIEREIDQENGVYIYTYTPRSIGTHVFEVIYAGQSSGPLDEYQVLVTPGMMWKDFIEAVRCERFNLINFCCLVFFRGVVRTCALHFIKPASRWVGSDNILIHRPHTCAHSLPFAPSGMRRSNFEIDKIGTPIRNCDMFVLELVLCYISVHTCQKFAKSFHILNLVLRSNISPTLSLSLWPLLAAVAYRMSYSLGSIAGSAVDIA